MQYKPKSLRRRRNTNKWECVLEHTNPITNATETTYHTVAGKTRNQAEQARNDLIVKLELEGFCTSSYMTVSQFMQAFLEYKINSKTIGSSTIRGYRGEICALRWGDFDEERRKLTVSHALGNGEGGFYLKEPKAGEARTLPLTAHTYHLLRDMKDDVRWMCEKLKVKLANTYILGTLESESRPYNPTQLRKDFAAFCKMNGFDCALHDLRHPFATFMIAEGADVRTVSGYLGHTNPSMTLDIYADVDPEAKERAVKHIEGAFDDAMSVFQRDAEKRRAEIESQFAEAAPDRPGTIIRDSIPFTVDELKAMLAVLESSN